MPKATTFRDITCREQYLKYSAWFDRQKAVKQASIRQDMKQFLDECKLKGQLKPRQVEKALVKPSGRQRRTRRSTS